MQTPLPQTWTFSFKKTYLSFVFAICILVIATIEKETIFAAYANSNYKDLLFWAFMTFLSIWSTVGFIKTLLAQKIFIITANDLEINTQFLSFTHKKIYNKKLMSKVGITTVDSPNSWSYRVGFKTYTKQVSALQFSYKGKPVIIGGDLEDFDAETFRALIVS